jgi:acyl-CoA synthetase (AMP-forming)/AMP-acid ligase II/thioesterase domain-containing protein
VFNVSTYGDRLAIATVSSPAPEQRALDELLARQAERSATAVAIAAPGRTPLSRSGLVQQIVHVRRALRRAGIARSDRVALVLPTGADTAAALVAVASSAACVPINPAVSTDELALHLEHANARAIVIDDSVGAGLLAVAESSGLTMLRLSSQRGEPAGTFRLDSSRQATACADDRPALPADIALVLLTSGTTSRPKVVALTHANLAASALNIARTLELTERDRCLDVNPLYHIHGIMVALAALASGGSVTAMPPLETPRILDWMDDVAPTWYSAVPTVHQAIVAALRRSPLRRPKSALRFVRSSSSALPIGVLAELERVFAAPVIESYGMTEACHQIASNPLPPRMRKPGTVGVAAGTSIAILDDRGRELGAGHVGEVAIRGASVVRGYESPADANIAAFAGEWLRTGDLGRLDDEGYLTLTGRIKELVNRGGEKISPHEIEAVLAAHPAVAQAVAFAVPHAALGEEVGAAVVLREGHDVPERELRTYASNRLGEMKRPRRLAIVTAIPTGPTGKFQRRLLASQLGMVEPTSSSPLARGGRALDTLESQLVELWERLLTMRPVGVRDDFFDLGGHSLLAAEMLDEVEEMTGIALPPSTLHEASTIQALAGLLIAHRERPESGPELVVLKEGADRPPFVLLHGDYNGGGFYCRRIAKRLDACQPFVVCAPHGTSGDPVPSTIEAMADDLVAKIEAALPPGPIVLGGFSQAGFVALEVALRLRSRGRGIEGLVVIDKPVEHPRWRIVAGLVDLLGRLRAHDVVRRRDAFLAWQYRVRRVAAIARSGPLAQARYVLAKLGIVHDEPPPPREQGAAAEAEMLGRRQRHLFDAYEPIVDAYVPRRYPGPILVVVSYDGYARLTDDPALGWRHVAREVDVRRVPGDHLTVVTTHVDALAACLDEWLASLAPNRSAARSVPVPPDAANEADALPAAEREPGTARLPSENGAGTRPKR